jgi:sugar O-acyltransferase (sialic acid O-acetyltransferase NeuD family)
MRRRLFIIGTGGLAREMAMLAEGINSREHKWEIAGFIAKGEAEIGKDLGIASIVGDDNWLLTQDFEADIVIGIGLPKIRAKAILPYLEWGNKFAFPNLIHPSAKLDYQRVELGDGNAITAGCNFTCDIQVGNYSLFNLNTTVGHDAVIGDFNVINPGANISGGVKLGNRILIGTGCQILENITIGDEAILGAGAVVTKNIPSGLTVVGVPAKPISK